MSTRKHLRNLARARMEREGVQRVNRYLGPNWRRVMQVYPKFIGKKRPGSNQPILIYRKATAKATEKK